MKRFNLYQKLYVYFLIVIVVSLSSVGLFTYTKASRELDLLMRDQMEQIVNNAVHHTDLYLKTYERSMVSLLTNRSVKEFIDLPSERDEYEYYHYRSLIEDIGVDPLFIRNPEIETVYMISFAGNAVYYFNNVPDQGFEAVEVAEHMDYLKSHTGSEGELSILRSTILKNGQGQMLTLTRQIRGLSSPQSAGILAIEIRAADLSAMWQGIDLGKDGYFFIMDENGQVVYHPDQTQLDRQLDRQFSAKIAEAGEELFELDADGEKRTYMVRKSDYSGWSLVVSKPTKEIEMPVSSIRTTTLIVGFFTLAFAFGLALRFGKSITRPIQALKMGMRETEKGNWATIPLPDHRDEIVELMVRYNLMVNRLSDLVEQVYQAELRNQESQMERQRAEFQSLQLQINPHFLYNTLETIVCYSFVRDSEDISDIVKSLAYMLRYSVQTNLEEITVANELKHVMYFMVVLRHRIGRPFELDVEIQPEYLLHKMVRLTLQPLVENVFQHAFPEGIEDFHYIRINAWTEDGMFLVSVKDNGEGMSADRLREMRLKLETNRLADEGGHAAGEKGGIGMLNVHRRIQMVFGEAYGLRIESEAGRGTEIRMLMPASQ
ncbi:sensor histidine kinase [Paenibacillus sp. PAMC21692]|uniref:sensor histidine kinase n=1 Tax=Paenibacillus sp. PAMC21692 TaxID=2762320 RepID=UPI00164E9DD3|nr:sensor histidine kinase [Paenibacillus sp. PAMC21692]QNK55832.1 histidine kinase [Paenibacillus sp. PAMC21692]